MKIDLESLVRSKRFSLAMFFCVVGFVLFKRLYRDLGDIFIFFVALGTIASICYNFRSVRKDPIFIAFWLSLAVPVASWLNSKIQIPDLAREKPDPFMLYDFFYFWFIAYWVNGKSSRILIILLAFCFSIISIYISQSPNFFKEITDGLHGSRIDFNVVNSQYTSLFAGFGFIATMFLFTYRDTSPRHRNVLLNVLALMLLLFFALVIIITQSRQAWLALLLCLLAAPLTLKLISKSIMPTRSILAIYMLTILAAGAISSLSIVESRLNTERETLANLTSLELDSIPNSTSIGVRIHLWLEAWDWIKERPVLGSGEESRVLVITHSETLPAFVQKEFTHLHSSHIETLLNFGFLGALLVYFLILYPPLYTATRPDHTVAGKWKFFSIITVIYWITVNFFESYFYSAHGIFSFSVFYGVIYSFRFTQPSNCSETKSAR